MHRSQEEKLEKDHNILGETMNSVRERRSQLLAQLPHVFPIRLVFYDKNRNNLWF